MSETVVREKCGTYAGWNAHQSRGELVCPDCRVANREYVRAYRAANPVRVERDRWWVRTRFRALERLAAHHPTEFEALLADERSNPADPPP